MMAIAVTPDAGLSLKLADSLGAAVRRHSLLVDGAVKSVSSADFQQTDGFSVPCSANGGASTGTGRRQSTHGRSQAEGHTAQNTVCASAAGQSITLQLPPLRVIDPMTSAAGCKESDEL